MSVRAYTVVSAVRHGERVPLVAFAGVVGPYYPHPGEYGEAGDVSFVEATGPAHAMQMTKEIPVEFE